MNIIQRLRGEAIAGDDLITTNTLSVPTEIVQQRLDICNACESFNKDISRCAECGCFMRLKTLLKSSKCPIGKW